MARIVLGAGASVAIYKACDLASKLTQAGHEVRAVLTTRAAKLVSPQLFEAVTGQPASVDEFAPERHGSMEHIDLSSWAELLLVAPCSAGLLARLALGLADELVGTVALALPAATPRLIAPAMNPNMLAAPAIRRHLETLRGDGWKVIEPGEGHMACGVAGKGRLPEPAELLRAVETALAGRKARG
jgi:phosphopantothenoylcysteine decarboxylase / phosphopantothenate---cysteine ligase